MKYYRPEKEVIFVPDKKIAIVADDVEMNRELLIDILEDEFAIAEAENGLQVMDIIHRSPDDVAVLLLDLMMPLASGFDVLDMLLKEGRIGRLPILIISGEKDQETEEKCLSLGVTDFIPKPFAPKLVLHRVRNAVALFSARDWLEKKVEEKTAELKERNEQLARNNEDTIELLGNVVEARSMESGTHVRRVKGFTRILARTLQSSEPSLGITDEDISTWGKASAMHDVGKIKVPDAVLLKPGKLTPEEFDEIKRHTLYGCEVLENSRHMWDEAYYTVCWNICRYHHEKWDGRGYPDGLKGEEIPIVAQVVAVADCFDALTTERVYKRAFTPDEAYDMITGGQCGAFNPVLMKAFELCRDDFSELALSLRSGFTADND